MRELRELRELRRSIIVAPLPHAYFTLRHGEREPLLPAAVTRGYRLGNLPFAEHLSVFRYADQPGMIGRVGTAFGKEGVNIISAAVGAETGGERAVMALTTDAPVHEETIEKILQLDGFSVGRSVDL